MQHLIELLGPGGDIRSISEINKIEPFAHGVIVHYTRIYCSHYYCFNYEDSGQVEVYDSTGYNTKIIVDDLDQHFDIPRKLNRQGVYKPPVVHEIFKKHYMDCVLP